MIIDKLGGINPLNNVQSSQRVSARSSVSFGSDSISVSAEAQELAEALYLSEVAGESHCLLVHILQSAASFLALVGIVLQSFGGSLDLIVVVLRIDPQIYD